METVFITIHDLSPDARIKYCSDSVEYILGYLPQEVKGKSCWDYFHPNEISIAKLIHDQSLGLDKAAVFNYCRVKHKDGSWIGCECVFTVVYDVLIASTAIYQRGPKAQRRASDGAQIRRIFSSTPRDTRYQMLSYISTKFYREPQPYAREARAAFFLNRFTRTSTIMFATNGISEILGIQPSQLIGKSFYYCIAQNCLDDAIRCLESAKANDSIAYLRFWYRNPTCIPEQSLARQCSLVDEVSEDEEDDGGVPIMSTSPSLRSPGMEDPEMMPTDENTVQLTAGTNGQHVVNGETGHRRSGINQDHPEVQSRSSSDDSGKSGSDAIFDPPSFRCQQSTASTTPDEESMPLIELEAVVSCTSDGLVVVLRRAKPLTPHDSGATNEPFYANGLFASPWAEEPMLPDGMQASDVAKLERDPRVDGVVNPKFMQSIRDVAVFAWSLTSINGSLADHARGTPIGEAQPPGGLPVWDPQAKVDEKDNDRWNGFANSTHRPTENIKIAASTMDNVVSEDGERDSSEDEVLWKRVPQQPPWRRPRRRAHQDAFESNSDDVRTGQDIEEHARPNKSIKKFQSDD